MPSTLEQGAVIRNRFNRETFTFSGPLDDRQVARFDVTLETGGPVAPTPSSISIPLPMSGSR